MEKKNKYSVIEKWVEVIWTGFMSQAVEDSFEQSTETLD
jgi:hypothetical protein